MKKSKIIITILTILLIISIILIIFLILNMNKNNKINSNPEFSKDAFQFKYDYEDLNEIQNSAGNTYNTVNIACTSLIKG